MGAQVGGGYFAEAGDVRDVRLQVAAAHGERAQAERLAREVMALYTCGPAGGGGATRSARQIVAVMSMLLPRQLAQANIHYEES